jgi:hypothetical protein
MGKRGRRGAGRPDQAAIDRARANNRSLLPLEVTFKAWASYTGQVELPGYEGWMRAALARLIPGDQPLAAMLPWLSQIAVLQLEEGYITSTRLRALKIGGSESETTADSTDSIETPPEGIEPSLEALRTEMRKTPRVRTKKMERRRRHRDENGTGRCWQVCGWDAAPLPGRSLPVPSPAVASYLASPPKQASDESYIPNSIIRPGNKLPLPARTHL